MAISGIGGSYGARSYYNYYALTKWRTQSTGTTNNPRLYGYGSNYHSTSKSARKYTNIMSDLLASANALADAGRSGVMNRYAVSSSNTEVATAVLDWPMYEPKDIKLDMERIARAQKNVSDSVSGDDVATSDMNFQVAGTGTASVAVNAMNSDGTTKTNRQMLEEAARQINAGEAGVRARVVEQDGMVSLEVESDKTGTSGPFGFAQRISTRAQRGLAEPSESLFSRKESGGIFTVVYPNGPRMGTPGFTGSGMYASQNYWLGRMLDLRG